MLGTVEQVNEYLDKTYKNWSDDVKIRQILPLLEKQNIISSLIISLFQQKGDTVRKGTLQAILSDISLGTGEIGEMPGGNVFYPFSLITEKFEKEQIETFYISGRHLIEGLLHKALLKHNVDYWLEKTLEYSLLTGHQLYFPYEHVIRLFGTTFYIPENGRKVFFIYELQSDVSKILDYFLSKGKIQFEDTHTEYGREWEYSGIGTLISRWEEYFWKMYNRSGDYDIAASYADRKLERDKDFDFIHYIDFEEPQISGNIFYFYGVTVKFKDEFINKIKKDLIKAFSGLYTRLVEHLLTETIEYLKQEGYYAIYLSTPERVVKVWNEKLSDKANQIYRDSALKFGFKVHQKWDLPKSQIDSLISDYEYKTLKTITDPYKKPHANESINQLKEMFRVPQAWFSEKMLVPVTKQKMPLFPEYELVAQYLRRTAKKDNIITPYEQKIINTFDTISKQKETEKQKEKELSKSKSGIFWVLGISSVIIIVGIIIFINRKTKIRRRR